VQPEGDIDFKGVYGRICNLAKNIKQPVILKEVGNGISKEVAEMFDGKIFAIDVQGAGGTTWIGVETYRSKGAYGKAFWDWGIPTALSVLESKSVFCGQVWASGGIRKPSDVVKALAIGAGMCGVAKPVLLSENKGGSEGVYAYLTDMIDGIKKEMAALGFRSVEELRNADVKFGGPLASLMRQRGLKIRNERWEQSY
jgi:isopentenyl-diphosphate delta-isomerase